MTAKLGTLDGLLKAADDKLQAMSDKAERAGETLDALSREIDARVDAALDPKEARK